MRECLTVNALHRRRGHRIGVLDHRLAPVFMPIHSSTTNENSEENEDDETTMLLLLFMIEDDSESDAIIL
jgi:hypothetical protein